MTTQSYQFPNNTPYYVVFRMWEYLKYNITQVNVKLHEHESSDTSLSTFELVISGEADDVNLALQAIKFSMNILTKK